MIFGNIKTTTKAVMAAMLISSSASLSSAFVTPTTSFGQVSSVSALSNNGKVNTRPTSFLRMVDTTEDEIAKLRAAAAKAREEANALSKVGLFS